MSRLTEREPHWLGEEFWVSAQEPDEEELDEVYMKLKHYEDLEEVLRTTLTEEAANAILSSPHDFKEWLERGQFYIRKIEERAVDFGYLSDWYISSVDETDEPVWTEKHIKELIGDFILITRNEKSEV